MDRELMGHADSEQPSRQLLHRRNWKIHVALATFLIALIVLAAWRLIPTRESIDSTYLLVSETGRWTFPEFKGRETTDTVFLNFKRDWGHPEGNERVIGHDAWKARMTALCVLAKLGENTIPVLLRGLDDDNVEVRDLAAQALGYLGDSSVIARLDQAIHEDPSPTVRIYATIARGSIAGSLPDELAQDILKHDPQPMVRARLELTQTRGQETKLSDVKARLAAFDLAKMDTARLGALAPDFSLRDLEGNVHRISEYRGKKNVVLVFVYGVTCMFCTGQISNLRTKLDEFDAIDTQILIVEANEPYRVRATATGAGMSKNELRLPILFDPSHTAAATYGVAMQMNHIEWLNRPSIFLIDRQGILRTQFLSASATDRPPPSVILNESRKLQSSNTIPTTAQSRFPKWLMQPTGL